MLLLIFVHVRTCHWDDDGVDDDGGGDGDADADADADQIYIIGMYESPFLVCG